MADLLNYGMNRFPVNFNNQISGLIGMTPGGGGQYPSSLNALAAAMTTNGKSPAYAFKVKNYELNGLRDSLNLQKFLKIPGL